MMELFIIPEKNVEPAKQLKPLAKSEINMKRQENLEPTYTDLSYIVFSQFILAFGSLIANHISLLVLNRKNSEANT